MFNMIWVAIRVDESGDHCLTTIPETASCTTLDLIRIFHSNFWSVLCILITQAPGPRLHIGDEAMCYVLMTTTAMSHTHTHTHTLTHSQRYTPIVQSKNLNVNHSHVEELERKCLQINWEDTVRGLNTPISINIH